MNKLQIKILKKLGYEVYPSDSRQNEFLWRLQMTRNGKTFPVINPPHTFASEDLAWADAHDYVFSGEADSAVEFKSAAFLSRENILQRINDVLSQSNDSKLVTFYNQVCHDQIELIDDSIFRFVAASEKNIEFYEYVYEKSIYLAAALHRLYGWEIQVALTGEDKRTIGHAWCVPAGVEKYIDIEGVHDASANGWVSYDDELVQGLTDESLMKLSASVSDLPDGLDEWNAKVDSAAEVAKSYLIPIIGDLSEFTIERSLPRN